MSFANSVNIARRLSVRNEQDMLQENMIEDKQMPGNYDVCKAMSMKLSYLKDLPMECRDHKSIVKSLQQKENNSVNSIAFQGMGNSAVGAAKARERGQENYAQIQRRFTNRKRFSNRKK